MLCVYGMINFFDFLPIGKNRDSIVQDGFLHECIILLFVILLNLYETLMRVNVGTILKK
jgi:hypothetical protein